MSDITENQSGGSLAIPDVVWAICPGADKVHLECPHCHTPGVHSATDWPQINTGGVFIIAPTVAYGVTCGACPGQFCWRPVAAVHPWPSGSCMEVECPGCNCTVSTQIAMVRELDEPLRPEDCDVCAAHFIVYPNGKTELPVMSGVTRGRTLTSLTFDPNGSRDWPFTTEVESLLTVPWLHQFQDGTQQFIDCDQEPALFYSPRLPPEALERFCGDNIAVYREFNTTHEAALDRRERVPMTCFW